MAQIAKSDIFVDDLKLLVNRSWLNDKIINVYMQLLMKRSSKEGYPSLFVFDTLFYTTFVSRTHSGVQSWTKKIDIFQYDLVGVPINITNTHWVLVVLDMRSKSLIMYDSLLPKVGRTFHEQALRNLLSYFAIECKSKRLFTFPEEEWKTSIVEDAPQQGPGGDCGVFVCQYMECLGRNSPFTFVKEDMPLYRDLMAHDIITGAVFPWPLSPSVQLLNARTCRPPVVSKPRRKRTQKEDLGAAQVPMKTMATTIDNLKNTSLKNIKVVKIIIRK